MSPFRRSMTCQSNSPIYHPDLCEPTDIQGMPKLLLSACLAGNPVRYDGGSKPQSHHDLELLLSNNQVVAFCPETAGGLGVPREAAEILGGDGEQVLDGLARIVTKSGEDVTDAFVTGARQALEVCQKEQIQVAILTEKSPSCGGNLIYDGSFTRSLRSGAGTTAALLKRHGIRVFNEHQIDEALRQYYALSEKGNEQSK